MGQLALRQGHPRQNILLVQKRSLKTSPMRAERQALGEPGHLEPVEYVLKSSNLQSVHLQSTYLRDFSRPLLSLIYLRILRQAGCFDLANAKDLRNTFTKAACNLGVMRTPTQREIIGNVRLVASAIAWRG